jgi:hypothetical protein
VKRETPSKKMEWRSRVTHRAGVVLWLMALRIPSLLDGLRALRSSVLFYGFSRFTHPTGLRALRSIVLF